MEAIAEIRKSFDIILTEQEERKKLSPHSLNLDEDICDPADNVPDPEIILVQESTGAPIFTKGGTSVLLGAPKSRKTTFAVGLCAAVLGDTSLGLKATSLGYKVVYIDTEQPERTCHMIQRKILWMIGWDVHKKCDHLIYCTLRKRSKEYRSFFVEDIVEREQPDVLVIDGIVDLCDDFNNIEKSEDVSQLLMDLTAKYSSMHICSIIHTNKGNGNPRGHLGAFLIQKGDVAFKVTDEQAYSDVSKVAALSEGCRFKPSQSFYFTVDNSHVVPELFDKVVATVNGAGVTKLDKAKLLTKAAFEKNGNRPMRRGELEESIIAISKEKGMGIGKQSAKDYISTLKRVGFLIQNEGKAYSLAQFDRNTLAALPIEEKEHQFDEYDPRDDEPPPF